MSTNRCQRGWGWVIKCGCEVYIGGDCALVGGWYQCGYVGGKPGKGIRYVLCLDFLYPYAILLVMIHCVTSVPAVYDMRFPSAPLGRFSVHKYFSAYGYQARTTIVK